MSPEVLTVTEFRKQVKTALDYCVQGGTIEIERMGQRFHLMHIPKEAELHIGNTPPPKKIKAVKATGISGAQYDSYKKGNAEADGRYCPNGHRHVPGRVGCMTKGCKFSIYKRRKK